MKKYIENLEPDNVEQYVISQTYRYHKNEPHKDNSIWSNEISADCQHSDRIRVPSLKRNSNS